MDEIKTYLCKYCKVEVVSRINFRPIIGRTHKKSCPRKRVWG